MKLLEGTKPGQRVAYVARRGSGTIAGLLVLGKPPAEPREAAPEAAPKPAREKAGIDERMDKLTRELEVLRERAAKRKAEAAERAAQEEAKATRARRQPSNIVGWLEREERLLERAKKAGNERAVAWHASRLQLLRELRQAGYVAPNRGSRNPDRAERRMRMLEERLEEVLERLERLEQRGRNRNRR